MAKVTLFSVTNFETLYELSRTIQMLNRSGGIVSSFIANGFVGKIWDSTFMSVDLHPYAADGQSKESFAMALGVICLCDYFKVGAQLGAAHHLGTAQIVASNAIRSGLGRSTGFLARGVWGRDSIANRIYEGFGEGFDCQSNLRRVLGRDSIANRIYDECITRSSLEQEQARGLLPRELCLRPE